MHGITKQAIEFEVYILTSFCWEISAKIKQGMKR
jgi:hypothetical protein